MDEPSSSSSFSSKSNAYQIGSSTHDVNNNKGSTSKQQTSNSSYGYNLRHLNMMIKDEFDHLKSAYVNEDDDDVDYHNPNSVTSKTTDARSIVIERQGGLANKFVLSLVLLWYFFSALTLYTNKYIVSNGKADPTLVG